ncbi:MAG: hypothetical protein JWO82_4362 [Akkermansiaceae bacterium]|nr:hypothetical protein [Akkermansiaceae bacterium]
MNPPPPRQPRSFRTPLLFTAGLAIGSLVTWSVSHHPAQGPSPVSQGDANAKGSDSKSPRTPGRLTAAEAAARPIGSAKSKEFADSVRAILHETVEERRVALFGKLLEKAGPEHYGVLVSLIRENDLRGCGSAAEWSALWSTWGKRDPMSALQFLKTQDWSRWNSTAPQEAQNRALTAWAQADPEAVKKYVENSSELANGDRSMIFGMIRGWSNVDPEATASWLFTNHLAMREEFKMVVESMSRQGGQEAVDSWFTKVSQTDASNSNLAGFAQAIAASKQSYEPEKAAAWVEEHLKEPWMEESEIVASTARAFASRDPRGAMEWAARTGLNSAATYAMSTWCQTDPQAAGTWLKDNPNNPAYSESAATLVSYLYRSNPEAAKNWADSIPDEKIRMRAQTQILLKQ